MHTSKLMARTCRWACLTWRVTFDPFHVLLWAWQEVKREAVSVDYHWWTLLAAKLRGRRRGCEVGVVARRMCCPAHTGNEVSCCVDGVVKWPC